MSWTMFGINPLLFQNSIFYNTVVCYMCDRMDHLQMKHGHRALPRYMSITYDGEKFVLIYLDLTAQLTSLFKWIKAFVFHSFLFFFFFWKCISKISKSSVPVSEPHRAGSHWSLCEWQTAFTTFPTTTFIWISKKKNKKKNQRNYINMHAVNIPPSTFRINVYFYYADNDTVFSTEGQMIMKTNI